MLNLKLKHNYLLIIINGPNLNYLGKREPQIYGNTSLDQLENYWINNLNLVLEHNLDLDINTELTNETKINLIQNFNNKLVDSLKSDLDGFNKYRHSKIKLQNSYLVQSLKENKDEIYEDTLTPITFQSNYEGEIIDFIYFCLELNQKYQSIPLFVINPAAYGHTSLALRDCLLATQIKFVEVHISNPQLRESYRKISFTNDLSIKCISGLGVKGYDVAIKYLIIHFIH